uniref:Probable pectate lyase F n=1 Tax=Radopholus similis TaxID=46012 RepID=A0A6C0W015_RADSI|nr:pectate lyase 1 [Radopholus similis]
MRTLARHLGWSAQLWYSVRKTLRPLILICGDFRAFVFLAPRAVNNLSQSNHQLWSASAQPTLELASQMVEDDNLLRAFNCEIANSDLAPMALLCFGQLSIPAATNTTTVRATIQISGTVDGKYARFVAGSALGGGDQEEDQLPIFLLKKGATLKNVIIGAPAADGVHCEDSCTLQNVWWEDVGEDAATFRSSSASAVFTVDGGGAQEASDKVFQHNGAGTVNIRNFHENPDQYATIRKLGIKLLEVKTTGSQKPLVGDLGTTGALMNNQERTICAANPFY